MRLLLDTHTFIWFVDDHPSLSRTAKHLLEDAQNQRILSIASPWEMAIKQNLGKLSLKISLERYLSKNLPLHHRDPFDRLIIAQAIVEDLTLISSDPALDQYPVNRRW